MKGYVQAECTEPRDGESVACSKRVPQKANEFVRVAVKAR